MNQFTTYTEFGTWYWEHRNMFHSQWIESSTRGFTPKQFGLWLSNNCYFSKYFVANSGFSFDLCTGNDLLFIYRSFISWEDRYSWFPNIPKLTHNYSLVVGYLMSQLEYYQERHSGSPWYSAIVNVLQFVPIAGNVLNVAQNIFSTKPDGFDPNTKGMIMMPSGWNWGNIDQVWRGIFDPSALAPEAHAETPKPKGGKKTGDKNSVSADQYRNIPDRKGGGTTTSKTSIWIVILLLGIGYVIYRRYSKRR